MWCAPAPYNLSHFFPYCCDLLLVEVGVVLRSAILLWTPPSSEAESSEVSSVVVVPVGGACAVADEAAIIFLTAAPPPPAALAEAEKMACDTWPSVLVSWRPWSSREVVCA